MTQNYPVQVELTEGKDLLLAGVRPVETETVSLENGFGRILAEDIRARENIPPFDRSPLDGYALRARDIALASREAPVTLTVTEEVPAGAVAGAPVGAMEAVRIMTGAPVPAGADAVVKYEDTCFTEHRVTLFMPAASGSNIVRAGEDVRAGDIVMEAGDVLNPARIGVLAGLGYPRVLVYRKPLVRIISTGDELVDIARDLAPGKIRNSSAYMIQAFLQSWGMDARIHPIVGDDKDQIRKALETCMEDADCVLTTGGVSVGDFDFVLPAMEAAGAAILFWKARMKPGMATIGARKGKTLLVGLSGNPSAAVAALFVLCLPALRRLCGRRDWELPVIQAVLAEAYDKPSPGGRVLPGRLEIRDGKPFFITQKHQANGMISPWSRCNLVGMVPKGTGPLEKGSRIEAYFLTSAGF